MSNRLSGIDITSSEYSELLIKNVKKGKKSQHMITKPTTGQE